MDLCCTLQAPTWVFGQILYLCVFSFAHLPADVVIAAILPPLLRKLPKRGPGQEHGWLLQPSTSPAGVQRLNFSRSLPVNHTTSWSTRTKGCKVTSSWNLAEVKSMCLRPMSPRWLLGPSCSVWDSSRRAIPVCSPKAPASSVGKA